MYSFSWSSLSRDAATGMGVVVDRVVVGGGIGVTGVIVVVDTVVVDTVVVGVGGGGGGRVGGGVL